MIASNNDNGGEHPEIAVANLKSPAFYAGDHPLECFAFWFYFSVSNKGFSDFRWPLKGQLISKCLFGVFNFFQKRTKTS